MHDPRDTQLNPSLKSSTETDYDTVSTTPSPFDSASAKEGPREGWSAIWLIILVACVAVTLYLVI